MLERAAKLRAEGKLDRASRWLGKTARACPKLADLLAAPVAEVAKELAGAGFRPRTGRHEVCYTCVVRFTWDAEKAQRNFRKHRISFAEAATVFADPLALSCKRTPIRNAQSS